jgi:hypothetical protein
MKWIPLENESEDQKYLSESNQVFEDGETGQFCARVIWERCKKKMNSVIYQPTKTLQTWNKNPISMPPDHA